MIEESEKKRRDILSGKDKEPANICIFFTCLILHYTVSFTVIYCIQNVEFIDCDKITLSMDYIATILDC